MWSTTQEQQGWVSKQMECTHQYLWTSTNIYQTSRGQIIDDTTLPTDYGELCHNVSWSMSDTGDNTGTIWAFDPRHQLLSRCIGYFVSDVDCIAPTYGEWFIIILPLVWMATSSGIYTTTTVSMNVCPFAFIHFLLLWNRVIQQRSCWDLAAYDPRSNYDAINSPIAIH